MADYQEYDSECDGRSCEKREKIFVSTKLGCVLRRMCKNVVESWREKESCEGRMSFSLVAPFKTFSTEASRVAAPSWLAGEIVSKSLAVALDAAVEGPASPEMTSPASAISATAAGSTGRVTIADIAAVFGILANILAAQESRQRR